MTGMPKKLRYTVEIDEEGYPMFDGLRVQDDDWTRKLLQSLHRQKDLPGQPWVADCEGENCWINAFDEPWVARTAEVVREGQSLRAELTFPGGFRESVALSAFRIDERDRLHAPCGAAAVPSVLSRSAQGLLLNALRPDELSRFAPPPYRSTERVQERRSELKKVWERLSPDETWEETFTLDGLTPWELREDLQPLFDIVEWKWRAPEGEHGARLSVRLRKRQSGPQA